ncbi:MAG: hypothetical protein ACOX0O_00250 [Candidatus Methanoculleus thermohydrogenotrophicum]|jgi:hypothetical protein
MLSDSLERIIRVKHHYTPRSLVEPVVLALSRSTARPPSPSPERASSIAIRREKHPGPGDHGCLPRIAALPAGRAHDRDLRPGEAPADPSKTPSGVVDCVHLHEQLVDLAGGLDEAIVTLWRGHGEMDNRQESLRLQQHS